MANREKGEVGLDINGQTYTLVMNTNAMVELQDACTKEGQPVASIEEIYSAVNRGSLRHIRAFLWAALQKYHPNLSVKAVGELIDEAGGFVGLNEIIESVSQASNPDDADVKELAEGNPPKARAKKRADGTGDVFRSMRKKSA